MGNVFDRHGNKLTTTVAFHPGSFLKEEIEARGLKKSELALQLNLLPGHLSEVFSGKRNISAQMAVRLEKVLGLDAELWMNLQQAFDLAIARKQEAQSAA